MENVLRVNPQLERVRKKMLLLQYDKLKLEHENRDLRGQLEFEARRQRIFPACHPDKQDGRGIVNRICVWLFGFKDRRVGGGMIKTKKDRYLF